MLQGVINWNKKYTYSLQLFPSMKQRIAYKMPFVRKCFLGCCSLGLTTLKILFSFFTLIINQAYCMWFKDAHFISQKHWQSPKCFPITAKMFRLLSVKHFRSRQLRLSSNSFWNNLLLLQPFCFLCCHFLFCKPPITACKLSFSSSSPLLVCFVWLRWLLHPARASTVARSGSVFGISFPSPFARSNLMQRLSQTYAQLRLGGLFCL